MYYSSVIGLLPIFEYKELYLHIIDVGCNILFLFMFLQFSSVLYFVVCFVLLYRIRSLNIHPALNTCDEKDNICMWSVAFWTVIVGFLFLMLQVVLSYAILILFCFWYKMVFVASLSVLNALMFSCLEVVVVIRLGMYCRRVYHLVQYVCNKFTIFNVNCRQTLLSNEIKRKQLQLIFSKLFFPIACLCLRVVFRLITSLLLEKRFVCFCSFESIVDIIRFCCGISFTNRDASRSSMLILCNEYHQTIFLV